MSELTDKIDAINLRTQDYEDRRDKWGERAIEFEKLLRGADAASEKAHRAGVAEGRAQSLLSIAEDDDLLEVGRKAVETALVEWRDSRLFEFPRGNGLVIRERDGKDSSMIRFGPEMGIRIGLKAIAQHLISLGIPRPGGEG